MAVDPELAKEHLLMLEGFEQLEDHGPLDFGEWLDLQLSLQKAAMGSDPTKLGPTPERAYFMLWNAWALSDELHEMIGETPWKPWATTTQFDRRALIREAVDLMHFLANLLLAANCTGEELTREYLKKNLKNLQRQLDGYDGKVEKCGYCGRDLGELDEYQRRRVVADVLAGKQRKFCDLTHKNLAQKEHEDA